MLIEPPTASTPPHEPSQQQVSNGDAVTLDSLKAELREAEVRAGVLNEQLAVTQAQLTVTHDQLAELHEKLAGAEAGLHTQRARADSLAAVLARTEMDSRQRLALFRAERARSEAFRRRLVEAGVAIPQTETELSDAREDGKGSPDPPSAEARDESSQARRQRSSAARPPRAQDIVTVIRPAARGIGINVHELWQYRHLLSALVRRNIRVEFDATRLGSIWGIMRPLLLAIVFVTFRNFSNAETREGLPYLVWVYTGLLFWTYFTDAATNAAVAVRNDASLLKKVYYPRLLTPIVPIIAGLVTLGVGVVPIIGMMAWYGIGPNWSILLLPLVVLQCVALALGLGTIISSISIENRDWERLFIFGLTVALWFSPVIYAPEMIPSGLRGFYALNPMVGLMLGFRAAMFADLPFPIWEWAYSLGASTVLLIVGVWAFRRTEIQLMDRL